jgi:hypothetical protein
MNKNKILNLGLRIQLKKYRSSFLTLKHNFKTQKLEVFNKRQSGPGCNAGNFQNSVVSVILSG